MSRSRSVSASLSVPAPPSAVFAVLADPRRHSAIDGSGTLRGVIIGPERLDLGSRFGMRMRLAGLPYRVTNVVTEFEKDRRIAWRHFGRHVWRYELEPVDGGTQVTETFDWAPNPARRLLELAGVPKRNARAMAATLARLRDVVAR